MSNLPLFPQNKNDMVEQENHLIIPITNRTKKRLKRFFIICISLVVLIKISPYFQPLMAPIGISFILFLLLSPLIDQMENHGLNRGSAIALIYLFFGAILILLIHFLIPDLAAEYKTISEALQNKDSLSLIQKFKGIMTQKIPILKNPEVANLIFPKLNDMFKSLLQKSLYLLVAILSSFTMVVTVPFITFFMLKDGRNLKKFILQCVPNRYFEMSLNLLHKTNIQLGNYIRGQLLVSFIIGSLAIVALYSLDVPYFFIIGIIAGMANMIPYFGPVVGALPAILVAIIETGSFGPVLGIVIAFAIIQLLDNVFISPLIVSKSIQIHPLMVIIVILIGSNIGGMLGMLVAVPTFAVTQVVIKEIIWSFKHYRLSD